MIKLDEEKFGALAISALRYCQGRQTYMVHTIIDIVTAFLQKVTDKDLRVMIEDCQYQKRNNLYGDSTIDKPRWIRFEQDLIEERNRRFYDKHGYHYAG